MVERKQDKARRVGQHGSGTLLALLERLFRPPALSDVLVDQDYLAYIPGFTFYGIDETPNPALRILMIG